MKATQEILRLLAQAKPELARRFGVRRLALFGSYARGEQREDSDVDVIVDVDPSIGLRFVDLAEEIEDLLGVRTDLVSRRAIKARNWEVIEKELIRVP
ncbi:MAG: nucleotidyltransferase domain-containing protein [Planctomycetes bacterium]|nr:nucleotidyltransferase domain-containing protein [Planctomycetota bacterium]